MSNSRSNRRTRQEANASPQWPPRLLTPWPPSSLRFHQTTDPGLADVVLDSVGVENLIYDRAQFYYYYNGVCRPLPLDALKRHVQTLDGVKVRGDDEDEHLRLTSYRVTGIVEAIRVESASPGFFDGARQGVIVFDDLTLEVDARGLLLREHRREDRALWNFPFACPIEAPHGHWLDPNQLNYVGVKTPTFDLYLTTTLDGEQRQFLAEWTGLTLVGRITLFALAVILYGGGSNGKSVFIATLRALFNAAGVSVIPPSELDARFGAVTLTDAVINLVDELPATELLAAGKLKAAISGGIINAERKHGPAFAFRPRAGHCFAANKLPATRDASDGFFRRFAVVVFNRKFTGASADLKLIDRILPELPGIAWWAIRNAVVALRRGVLNVPNSVRLATDEWRDESDQVKQFLEDQLVPASEPITLGTLVYGRYMMWAPFNGHRVMAAPTFGRRLHELGVARRRTSHGILYAVTLRPDAPTVTIL